MIQADICLYAQVFVNDKNLFKESFDGIFNNGIMCGFLYYNDMEKCSILNDLQDLYVKLINNKWVDFFIAKNDLFLKIQISVDFTIKAFPIVNNKNDEANPRNDLGEYIQMILELCDNFKIEEINSLGRALNKDLFV